MAVVMSGGPAPASRILIPRAARIPLTIPVVFACAEGRVKGRSIDISESGILATFERPLDIWITGHLSILVPEHPIFLDARIARVESHTAAMSFRTMTARDSFIIHSLINKAARQSS
ncbi:MAG: PilZ domain-containing protein [Acidobacteriota bacterium]